ncbi:MAG: insulinase family protein [Bryobacteraceae bacterium]|nr:insulinase family protein [Bryobacteraceae bacterium]MCX7603798.1 insulinase family protein [Bryobacteraceae bacterium]
MQIAHPGGNIRVSTLSNGITVLTERVDSVRSVSVGFWLKAGSRYESPQENGISHFVEHMLFKGTETRSAEDLAREMDALGGFNDAFTGRDTVCYSFKVLDEHLERAMEIQADLVLHPRFDPEDIEKEKNVVLEELKMGTDNPETFITDLFVRHFWKRHPLGQPVIGTRKTIRSFTAEALRRHHQSYYRPENLLIAASGRLDHDRFAGLAERLLGGLRPGGVAPCAEPPAPSAPLILRSRRSLQQVHVCLGAPSVPAADPRRYAVVLLNAILGVGMSSRLFQNIRERLGLAYAIFSELLTYDDAGMIGIYASTSADTARRLLEAVMAEIRRLKQEPPPASELALAREATKAAILLSLESTTSRMGHLARQWLSYRRFYTVEETAAALDRVTPEQIQEEARLSFRTGSIGLAVLGRVSEAGIGPADLEC